MINILCVEGIKNVGKTYLLNRVEHDFYMGSLILNKSWRVYKFPFSSYFNSVIGTKENKTGQNDFGTYMFSVGFDLSIFSLAKADLVKTPIILDRGFLSNLVLGEAQGRINREEGIKHLRFLQESGYLDETGIVYVESSATDELRNKDQWEDLNRNILSNLYEEYLSICKELKIPVIRFVNNFDEQSTQDFLQLLNNYEKNLS
jgi:hypothetical protein